MGSSLRDMWSCNSRSLLPAQKAVLDAALFGQDNIPFSVVWTGTTGPTTTRNYNDRASVHTGCCF